MAIKMKDRIIFEYSPIDILSTQLAFEMSESFLKAGHKVVIERNRIKDSWNYKILPLKGSITHHNFNTFLVELNSQGNLVVISVDIKH